MGEGSAACRWTYFEKRNFMGIELDVLVGHPEHDLLFVATQVALAAQMKNPKQSVNDLRNLKHDRPGQQLSTLVKDNLTSPPRVRYRITVSVVLA
ncbi:hypothetical protein C1Y30_20395 [Pseudomonas sp. GW704-F3]|nr:hypothetical protein C1Y30_20395 [Pseudomonas sp. GW704-F3]PMU94598.1 hypothetical protein C1Y28_16185 [Pseudomonas sp. GW704-F5]PMV02843.1 hypothetical protein C1Y29_16145 [Pseudomonas sp. MPBD4-3]PMV24082.1 hypothetical protein C1Y27_25395 [Pseudomonas sp. GW704-F2]